MGFGLSHLLTTPGLVYGVGAKTKLFKPKSGLATIDCKSSIFSLLSTYLYNICPDPTNNAMSQLWGSGWWPGCDRSSDLLSRYDCCEPTLRLLFRGKR